MSEGLILFQCKVIDSNDPLMLGRVRAEILIEYNAQIAASQGDYEPWDDKDPFVFLPLLPYYVYQVPLKDELIQAMFVNKDRPFQNQYYVQSNFYSVFSSYNTDNVGAQVFTGLGNRFNRPLDIKTKDGKPFSNTLEGQFPEPGDNALMGRGNADIIVKRNELLLRAGKYKSEPQSNNVTVGNDKKGFLQVTQFPSKKILRPATKITNLITPVLQVNYLIEWTITNPENTQNKFCGSVYLYQLKPSVLTNSENLNATSVLPLNLTKLVASDNFFGLSVNDTVAFINNFIKTCNDSDIYKGRKIFFSSTAKFPIFFRPSNLTASYMNPSNLPQITNQGNQVCPTGSSDVIYQNLQSIFTKIKLNPSDNGGFGLIWKQGQVGIPTSLREQEIIEEVDIPTPTTFAAMGADKLFLLSYESSIDGKKTINFDNTIYGISDETFNKEILPNTSSSVRGEELLELLELVVEFLLTHTHAYPGLVPDGATETGVLKSSVEDALATAYEKVLNKNIRLN
jgi:hypothetical protein